MSFYTGVVPADGLSAQAGINWSPHQQTTGTNLQSPTSVRVTSNSSNYAAPITPAQAYARSVVSGQPVLQYTIERQQLEQTSGQQPGPNLTSPIGASASTRGQSYAQRLYASSLGKQPQVQTPLQPSSRQPSSSGPGESSDNRVPAGPRPPYGARASLMLNTSHINALQPVSALDFYHSSVSKLDLQSPVPDRGTNSQVARRPQSATGSASNISVAHSSVPIQAPYGRGPVPVELSDGPPPSPASDPRRSSQAGLRSRSPPSTMDVIPVSSLSQDIPLRPESVNNVIASPVPSETPPRELSPYSEDYVAAITSNPESATQPSDPLPASIQNESLGVGGSEEVPLYSLIDDEPPPPDFNESQSMCSVTRASMYHAEAPIVLAPPSVPSPTPHESDAVSGAVTSTSADTPSFIGISRTLSPEPLSESPRTSLAMPEVASYPMEKAPEDVKERSYGYSAEDSMPKFSEKSSSYPSMEASSSSRTLSEQVPPYGQPRYNTAPQDIPHPPFFPAVSPRDDSSAKAFSTAPLPVVSPRRPVASTPAPITAPAPPPTSLPSSPKASAVNPVAVRPATSLPLRSGSSRLPSSPPPPPRVMAAPTFPPSSAGTPPFIAASAGTTSQMYYAASPSPLPSPSLSQRSRGTPVLSAPSADTRPAEFRLQLSPDVSPTLQGQAPYQSPRESFQRPVEFRPQLCPTVSPTLQGQAPYQSPRESFQRPVEFRPQLSPTVSPTLQGYAHTHSQAPYQSPRQNFQSQASPPPPPPPQHARANTSPPQSVQSSRGLGTNIATGLAGGVLGLLGGAVLAETLGGGDIVNDITGSMDGMTFGNPADGLFDPNMGAGDMIGSGFDSTANFQGDQTFAGDSFDPSYYQGDQPFSGDSFGQTYDMSDQTMGNEVDPGQFQGQSSMQPGPYFASEQTQQIDVTQTSDVSQSQQQPGNQSNQSSGTHYLHDAGLLLQAAYKMYNTPHQSGTAQGSQGSQTTALLQQTPAFTMSGTSNSGRPPNSLPIGYAQTSASISFHGTSFDHFTTSGYPSPTQQTGQSMHPMASQTAQAAPTATPFSQYHPSVNSASQQGTHPHSHHHASPQSSHTSHTQSPYMNHVAYPSFGAATHTMCSQGLPIPAQYAVNHGHGTAPHHAYSLQSQATHPAQYPAQGNSQQSPTGQQPPSAGLNKTVLAKQFVKGALMAGGVFARYNRLSGGNGFVGNGNGNNGGYS
ncbi:hypothetical protein EV702DRAFT_1203576 [Suillus placidus]|uniref:Uncharacterized protein n=1 Tax=Suillus placidus TaxID=48579 RepID=A0A9P7CWW6_9AGAM|nr:hypothetical protein EV702DRAFT_1203576 [Suillus placidus]